MYPPEYVRMRTPMPDQQREPVDVQPDRDVERGDPGDGDSALGPVLAGNEPETGKRDPGREVGRPLAEDAVDKRGDRGPEEGEEHDREQGGA